MNIRDKLSTLAFAWMLAQVPFAHAATGEDVYKQNCARCHDEGATGAPRLGVAEDWTHRVQQDMAVLLRHATDGFKAMPAKGGNFALKSDEVALALDYLLHAPQKQPSKQATSKQGIFQHAVLGKPFATPLDSRGYFQPPPDKLIPRDKYGDEVLLGKLIFTETTRYAARYAGRALNCSSCHLDAGRKPNAMPMWGAAGMYPTYRLRSDRNDNLADRIQACFRYSLNGIAPAHDAPEMRALLSYVHFISRGAPIGVDLPGRGLPDTVMDTGFEASPTRGREEFENKCAACHGLDGDGQRSALGNYTVPPLWGWNSYNKGAGLHNNQKLARFIKANMPLGSDFSLTDQEALDIAAFINMHDRPKNPDTGLLTSILGK